MFMDIQIKHDIHDYIRMFYVQVYSDKSHGISGPHTSRHLYKLLTSFIKDECWDGGEPRDVINGEEQIVKKQ